MKNFLTLLTAVVFLAVSCVPEDESFHATSFENAASVTVPSVCSEKVKQVLFNQ
jgi:hypothetical protein